ncbi:MAG TPA: RNA polymerase sigma-54 factor, partial [Hymenobacter sp.]
MQRLDMKQLLSQKLSPQQIQFIKLLQIPTAELETRIKEELELNPALEEGDENDDLEEQERDDSDDDYDDPDSEFDNDDNTLDEDFDDRGEEQPEIDLSAKDDSSDTKDNDDLDLGDYINDDEIAGYKMQGDGPGEADDDREMPLADTSGSLIDSLMDQLSFAGLDEKQAAIGRQLIGSIDNDGYIRRDLSAIANDLAFSQNI